MTNGKPSDFRWWQRGVFYQIYPRSFMDANGDGIGDLNGLIQRLDYLNDGTENSLGVEALWLSPIFPSPMVDFGYDVSDYCDIHPLFGNLATFDRLVAEAHRRNMKVVIDYVPNHTSDRHPWFADSRKSRTSAKRDWYVWRDPKPDGSPPNNWGGFFGGPAWTLDPTTGQCYLHQFTKEQPELNWRNPELRAAMLDVLRFWLERGVDGFRMDVIGLIVKDAALRDNPPNPKARKNLPPNDLFNRQLQIYNWDQEEVHEVLREIRAVLDAYDDRCAIGELWGDLEQWVRYYGRGPTGDELHLPFNFRLMDQPWKAERLRRSVNELEASLPAYAWPNYVLGNHDRPRLASRYGGQAQARVAAMLLLTLRGTPTLYNGDELGLENVPIPPERIQDPPGKILGPEHSRDRCRTPMQWNGEPGAGFSTAEPWLPFSPDQPTRNVAVQSADPSSILNLYRRLLQYRRRTPALLWGAYRDLNLEDDCFGYAREAGAERRVVCLNFSETEKRLCVPEVSNGKVVLSTHLDRVEPVFLSALTLRPFEGVVIEL
jgi:alpha-glucosidase